MYPRILITFFESRITAPLSIILRRGECHKAYTSLSKILLMTFIFCMLAVSMAWAAGDIDARSIEYSADMDRLVATVHAEGIQGEMLFYFYDNEVKVGEARHDSVLGSDTFTIYTDYMLSEGSHTISVVADPLNSLGEANRENNEIYVSLIFNPLTLGVVTSSQNNVMSYRTAWIYVGFLIIMFAIFASFWRMRGPHTTGRLPRAAEPSIEWAEEGQTLGEKIKSIGKSFHRQESRKEKKASAKIDLKAEEPGMQKAEEKPQAEGFRIMDIFGLQKGTGVGFKAQINFQDKIGNDYAYFLKDDTGEVIGFSKNMINKKNAFVTGTVDYFLGDNTIVMISGAE
jgi:hypothetical protein